MQLYISSFSPNARRTVAVAKALGLDVEVIELDFSKGEMQTPEFLAKNPNGKVPVLVDGDYVLWESNAITLYLASKAEASTLVPTDNKEYHSMLRWMFWETAHFTTALTTINFQKFAKPSFGLGDPDMHLVENALENFHRFAKVLEDHLQGRTWIMGDTLTLADFSVGATLMYAGKVDLPWQDYSNMRAWYQRLESEKCWAECAPQADQAAA